LSEEEEEDDGKKVNLQQHLSALESISTARKYVMRFDVNSNMMAALRNVDSSMFRADSIFNAAHYCFSALHT
jgi:hypothetical protein